MNTNLENIPFNRLTHYFIVIDRNGKPVYTQSDKQAMIDICNSPEGMKGKYRMLECLVTKIHIFGAFSGEREF